MVGTTSPHEIHELRVLVVCTGNICRSPAATALLRHAEVFGSDAVVTSAGTHAVVGAPIDPEMAGALSGIEGLELADHVARQASRELVAGSDLVLTASTRQKETLLSQSPEIMGKVFTLREFAAIAQGLGRVPSPEEAHDNRHLLDPGLPLSIPDPHRRGPVAMKLAALDLLDVIDRMTGFARPEDALAVTAGEVVTVMSSSNDPTETTNPYIVELFSSLEQQESVSHVPFSWRTAVTGKVDVFHSHWPEAKLVGNSFLKTFGRHVLFALMLLNFRVRRTAVVQTIHNLEPHESPNPVTRFLIDRLARLNRVRIAINDATAWTPGAPVRTIVHGHLRYWYAGHPKSAPESGTLSFVGLIRPYKGVAEFLEVFRMTPGPYVAKVAGRAEPSSLGAALEELAELDPRVRLELGFIDDEDLVATITSSVLAVLPYRQLHNSGAAMAAFSLDRPVLVPENDSTNRLAIEVGEEWVIRYSGALTPSDLEDALRKAAAIPEDSRPDLSRRDWDLAGAQHAAVFREAALRPRKPHKDDVT